MRPLTKRLLYWTPRVLTILFAIFISLLALDVFTETAGFWNTTLALLMHLIPTAIIIAVLVLSWRREWIAGIVYIGLGIFYIASTWSRFHLTWLVAYLTIAGPMLLAGGLFILNWLLRGQLRSDPEAKL